MGDEFREIRLPILGEERCAMAAAISDDDTRRWFGILTYRKAKK
jgi:hypothetical protein